MDSYGDDDLSLSVSLSEVADAETDGSTEHTGHAGEKL